MIMNPMSDVPAVTLTVVFLNDIMVSIRDIYFILYHAKETVNSFV